MKRVRVIGGAIALCAVALVASQPVAATEASTTKVVQAYATPGGNAYNIIATLDPAHPDDEMAFTLYKKKKNGMWAKVAKKSFTQGAEDAGKGVYYANTFNVVKGKKCKIVAKFAGDEDHAASKDAQTFACKA